MILLLIVNIVVFGGSFLIGFFSLKGDKKNLEKEVKFIEEYKEKVEYYIETLFYYMDNLLDYDERDAEIKKTQEFLIKKLVKITKTINPYHKLTIYKPPYQNLIIHNYDILAATIPKHDVTEEELKYVVNAILIAMGDKENKLDSIKFGMNCFSEAVEIYSNFTLSTILKLSFKVEKTVKALSFVKAILVSLYTIGDVFWFYKIF